MVNLQIGKLTPAFIHSNKVKENYKTSSVEFQYFDSTWK